MANRRSRKDGSAMENQEFQNLLVRRTRETEERIREVFQRFLVRHRNIPYIRTVTDAMEYSFLAGGKRLRPLLMHETFLLFSQGETGGEKSLCREALYGFMTALEMIHTYSLVHDDLPAMDNDEYRRGKETTWKVYGEGMGVLAGDALMNSAFEMGYEILCRAVREGADGELLLRLSRCGEMLSGKAGVSGMLGGQAADVEAEEKELPMTMERILFIHTGKTAALIECAMGIGALLGGADEKQLKTVTDTARKVGIAFQIQDDILDVTGSSEELGKPVGSDAANGKQTYVTLKGLEQSAAQVEKLSREAIEGLRTLPGDHAFLENLISALIYRKK